MFDNTLGISAVDLKTGTTEELLNKELSEEQRFIIETMHIFLHELKEFIKIQVEISAPKYLDICLRLISNLAINTLIPFVRGGPQDCQEVALKESLKLMSAMIYAGWESLEAEKEGKTAPSH